MQTKGAAMMVVVAGLLVAWLRRDAAVAAASPVAPLTQTGFTNLPYSGEPVPLIPMALNAGDTYTTWGSYEFNDSTGKFDKWVAVVQGATPPYYGESRDAYESRMKALLYV